MKQEPRMTQAPSQVYAAVGASLVLRDEAMAVPGRLRAALDRVDRAKNQVVTTTAQMAFEARERVFDLPSEVAGGRDRLLARFQEAVVDLRDGGQVAYRDFAASGERALELWQAERLINRRVDRVTRSVAPGVARAAVSARAGQRQAARSGASQRARLLRQRVRSSVERIGEEYLAAVDETSPVNPPATHR